MTNAGKVTLIESMCKVVDSVGSVVGDTSPEALEKLHKHSKRLTGVLDGMLRKDVTEHLSIISCALATALSSDKELASFGPVFMAPSAVLFPKAGQDLESRIGAAARWLERQPCHSSRVVMECGGDLFVLNVWITDTLYGEFKHRWGDRVPWPSDQEHSANFLRALPGAVGRAASKTLRLLGVKAKETA